VPLVPFKESVPLSLGVELELQLINPGDFNLSSSAQDLLTLLNRKPFPGTVVPEMTESMIEISTGVHQHYQPLRKQLQEMRDVLVSAGDVLNVGICGGGTHPFQKWSEQSIFPKARFKDLSTLYGYLAKQLTVFGQHIHVGCPNGDDALYLLHALGRYVPQFIALSASSPFVQGRDTLFNSARLNSIFAFPLSGRAPFVLSWQAFESDYFAKMQHTGIVSSMKDFYWDIRPKPEYGTIELRVCDTPLSVEKAATLAAYLQAICARLLDGRDEVPREDDYLVYNYNRFQACRFGLDGVVVDPQTYEQISLREDILKTLRQIEDYSNVLESGEAMEMIYQSSHEGSDAHYLRKIYHDEGSVEAIVNTSLDVFRRQETD